MWTGFRRLDAQFLLVVGIASLLALAACVPSGTATPPPTSTTAPSPSPTPTRAATAPPPTSPPPTTVPPTQAPTAVSTAPPTAGPTQVATPQPTFAPGQKEVTIDLVAENLLFNMTTITVPAGADVTVNLDNLDAAMPHNFAVYRIGEGAQITPVYLGGLVTGPGKITYRFKAPEAGGNYFFECDVHPDTMNGKFIVTA